MTSVIAVTGASGSGKSAITDALVERHRGDPSLPSTSCLSVDAYYRDLSHLTFAERDELNYDHPDAIEFELFEQHLGALRAGEAVLEPSYDFATHTRIPGGTQVIAAERLIIEGVLLGAWEALRAQVDTLIFVDTPLELCFERRLRRDCDERGRDAANVQQFWNDRALPAFLAWRDRARSEADLVVRGNVPLAHIVDTILAHIAQR